MHAIHLNLPALGALGVIICSACGTVEQPDGGGGGTGGMTEPVETDGLAGAGGTVQAGIGGSSTGGGVASGGAPGVGGGTASGGVDPFEGDSNAPYGGNPSWSEGDAVSEEGTAWLAVQGELCEPTSAEPTDLPSEPDLDCGFFEIGLPGVIDYKIDPVGIELDRFGYGGMYYYLGCDEVGAPCTGRLAYDWDVAYLADNEWAVSITPLHPQCDYQHVLLHELPTGELSPRATVWWVPFDLTVHLQPTAAGVKIGAVRSALDEAIDPTSFTELGYNGGWEEVEFRALFVEAFTEHLQSLEWECSHEGD